MNKKKIILWVFLGVVLTSLLGTAAFYYYGMSPKDQNSELREFVLSKGTSKLSLVEKLEQEGFISNALVLKAYLFFHSELNLQAGTYELSSNMAPKDILKKMSQGEIKNDSTSVMLVPGRRLKEYVEQIASKIEITENELWNQMSDQTYLRELITKYWFLEDSILNTDIYYPLEGYFTPDTYTFYEHSTAKEVIEKILNQTENKLEPLKDQIQSSNFSVHEILSMASIIELEAVNENDRKTVSQVIQKRLSMKKGLGMDVTTYYAVKKDMKEGLTLSDLKTVSPYNTSEMNSSMAGKLPIGPICNISVMSIRAALEPTDTDYLFFYADVKTGKVYFSKTYEEHVAVQKEIG
ncbi:MAG: endolytic transglycosylase MltG [Bacilli bacterium]|nr:endolytic transglycosylase MltG [Bacilli bacterium]